MKTIIHNLLIKNRSGVVFNPIWPIKSDSCVYLEAIHDKMK